MPGIAIEGKRWPTVSTEIFGEQDGAASEVTLVAVVQGCVQLCAHDYLVEYAAEALEDPQLPLSGFADQVLAPHPDTGQYVPVELAFDHNGSSRVILFDSSGRLYEWAI